MGTFLEQTSIVVRAIVLTAAISFASWAIATFFCWLFYSVKGRPTLHTWQRYSSFLFGRGVTVAVVSWVTASALIGACAAGFNITARLPGAVVEIKTDTTHAGKYARVLYPSTLDLDSSHVYFIEVSPVANQKRQILRAVDGAEDSLAKEKWFSIKETRWITRYPKAKIFNWLGAIYDRNDLVEHRGQQEILSGLELWKTIPG